MTGSSTFGSADRVLSRDPVVSASIATGTGGAPRATLNRRGDQRFRPHITGFLMTSEWARKLPGRR